MNEHCTCGGAYSKQVDKLRIDALGNWSESGRYICDACGRVVFYVFSMRLISDPPVEAEHAA